MMWISLALRYAKVHGALHVRLIRRKGTSVTVLIGKQIELHLQMFLKFLTLIVSLPSLMSWGFQ